MLRDKKLEMLMMILGQDINVKSRQIELRISQILLVLPRIRTLRMAANLNFWEHGPFSTTRELHARLHIILTELQIHNHISGNSFEALLYFIDPRIILEHIAHIALPEFQDAGTGGGHEYVLSTSFQSFPHTSSSSGILLLTSTGRHPKW